MSGFLIAALVFVVIVAAAVALLGAANRRQADGATGASTLGREAIRRDKAARRERAAQEASAPPTGREIERVAVADVPIPFQGNAIALITAGLMSMAFMGFAGLVVD